MAEFILIFTSALICGLLGGLLGGYVIGHVHGTMDKWVGIDKERQRWKFVRETVDHDLDGEPIVEGVEYLPIDRDELLDRISEIGIFHRDAIN